MAADLGHLRLLTARVPTSLSHQPRQLGIHHHSPYRRSRVRPTIVTDRVLGGHRLVHPSLCRPDHSLCPSVRSLRLDGRRFCPRDHGLCISHFNLSPTLLSL